VESDRFFSQRATLEGHPHGDFVDISSEGEPAREGRATKEVAEHTPASSGMHVISMSDGP
jgi:hypothetical protein